MNSGKNKFQVAGLGEILWDLYAEGKQLGGAPANFAYHAQQHGAQSYVISSIGNDTLGQKIITHLDSVKLSHRYITIDHTHPTGVVTIELDDAGKPVYRIHENAAWDHIPCSENTVRLVQNLDAICFGSLSQRTPESANTIQEILKQAHQDCLRVFDINIRLNYYSRDLIDRLLALCNVLKLNDEEIVLIADLFNIKGSESEILKTLTDKHELKLIVLTKGVDGSRLYSGTEDSDFAGVKAVKIIDTVGAGDSFTATVVMGFLSQRPLDEINLRANQVACYVCSQKGAMPVLPDHLLF